MLSLQRVQFRFRKLQATAVRVAAIIALGQLFGCGTLPGLVPSPVHPLRGKLWDVAGGRMVTQEAMLGAIASARLILLGEVHDNPEHHRLQAAVLRAAIAQGRRPALALEQFDREFQPAVDTASAQPGASADSVARAGGFDRVGWSWRFYEPLLAAAVDARLPIIALNLSRERARQVARQGFAVLGAAAASELALDAAWNPAREATMRRELADGHCGQLPAATLPRMVSMQRARDAIMADALVGRLDAGAIVIAGKEHVRNDIGLPVYLANRVPGERLVSIGFIEVEPGLLAPSDYVRPLAPGLPFDYVWFTSAADRNDPCAGLQIPDRR